MVFAVLKGGYRKVYGSLGRALAAITKKNLKTKNYWIKSFSTEYEAEEALRNYEYELSVRKGKKDRERIRERLRKDRIRSHKKK